MIKVIILQPYNTPYRNPFFNEIAGFPDIDLYVVYFGSREQSRKWEYNYEPKFKEVQLNIKIRQTDFESNLYKYSFFNIIQVLLSIKPNVIIGHPNKIGKIIGLLQPFFGYKLISWTEDTVVTMNGKKYGFKHKLTYYNKVKSFLVPGKLALEYLIYAGIKINDSNVFYAPNTIDDEMFNFNPDITNKKFSNDLRHLNFLFSGYHTKTKGVDLLYEAIYILNKKKYKYTFSFDMVGESIIKEDNIKNVTFHGFQNGKEYIDFFKKNNILVLPSRHDCNPLVVIEALKSGMIILVSKGVGSYPEYTNGNGFSFEANNVDSLVEAMEKILLLELPDLIKMSAISFQLGQNITAKHSASVFYKAIVHSLKK
jgi:glycosyltransferase involved in cell wall biosynthesis